MIVRPVQFVKRNVNPKTVFLLLIVVPARRALDKENIKTVKNLSKWSEKEIISLHGMGPSTIPKLKKSFEG